MRWGFTRLTAGVITGARPSPTRSRPCRKNPEILVATPGRLLEHLEGDEVDLGDLEILVLDEADRMLDMGFADDVLAIIGRCNPQRQSLLFSATLHHKGLAGITGPLLRDPQTLVINPVREQHPDIDHQILLSDEPEHKERQLVWLLEHEPFDKALVFTNTRERTVSLGAFLIGKGQRWWSCTARWSSASETGSWACSTARGAGAHRHRPGRPGAWTSQASGW